MADLIIRNAASARPNGIPAEFFTASQYAEFYSIGVPRCIFHSLRGSSSQAVVRYVADIKEHSGYARTFERAHPLDPDKYTVPNGDHVNKFQQTLSSDACTIVAELKRMKVINPEVRATNVETNYSIEFQERAHTALMNVLTESINKDFIEAIYGTRHLRFTQRINNAETETDVQSSYEANVNGSMPFACRTVVGNGLPYHYNSNKTLNQVVRNLVGDDLSNENAFKNASMSLRHLFALRRMAVSNPYGNDLNISPASLEAYKYANSPKFYVVVDGPGRDALWNDKEFREAAFVGRDLGSGQPNIFKNCDYMGSPACFEVYFSEALERYRVNANHPRHGLHSNISLCGVISSGFAGELMGFVKAEKDRDNATDTDSVIFSYEHGCSALYFPLKNTEYIYEDFNRKTNQPISSLGINCQIQNAMIVSLTVNTPKNNWFTADEDIRGVGIEL